jgi:hypothetical protein
MRLILMTFHMTLALTACQTLGITEKPSPSEQVLEILSTAPELNGNCILLCIEKDCLVVDRRKPEKGLKCEVPRKTRVPSGRGKLSSL